VAVPRTSRPEPSFFRQLGDIFKSSKMPAVPLDQAFDNNTKFSHSLPSISPAQVSTLSNGVRLVSIENYSPITSLGIFVDAGSRYEDAQTAGASHFLEQLAVKSTEGSSAFKLIRDMSAIGGNLMASTSRETMIFTGEAVRDHVPVVANALVNSVFRSKFDEWEIDDIKHKLVEDAKDAGKRADLEIMDAIHAAAYHNNTLGLPVVPRGTEFEHINAELLRSFASHFIVPSRIVVAGVGIKHEDLVNLFEPSLNSLAGNNQRLIKQPANYTGGEIRQHAHSEDGLLHVALAFEGPSMHDPDLVPMCVLQMLMGGGLSFSAGGPGKGMYSRLYERVLNRYGWAQSANCFSSLADDSSLFGIYASAPPSAGAELATVVTHEAAQMAQNIDDVELARARNQLKSSIFMHLETRSLLLEDIGRQVLAYNKVETAQELCARVDQVSSSDLQRVANRLLKSQPSLAVYGDTSSLPHYDAIVKNL